MNNRPFLPSVPRPRFKRLCVPVFTGARRPANGTASALGMEVLPLDPQLRKELHVPKEVNGVVVGKVASDSPAGELGIQPGDVIL